MPREAPKLEIRGVETRNLAILATFSLLRARARVRGICVWRDLGGPQIRGSPDPTGPQIQGVGGPDPGRGLGCLKLEAWGLASRLESFNTTREKPGCLMLES